MNYSNKHETTSIEDLILLTRAGDKAALQELRARGYFEALKAQEDGAPLLQTQRGMWTLHNLSAGGGTGNCNISGAYLIKGHLQENALAEAGQKLIERHEALRACFIWQKDGPRQRIQMSCNFKLDIVDLKDSDAATPQTHDAVRAAAEQAFDLTTPPLLRMHLFRLSEQNSILLLVMHHIIGDGWSVGILMKELAILYTAAVTGISVNLPPSGSWYRYITDQSRRLASPAFESVRRFWLDQLNPFPEAINLPADHSRPLTPSYTGSSHLASVPFETVKALESLAKDTGTSLFLVINTAIKALCYRLTGKDDLLTTFPFSGRENPDEERTVGLFMRALPLRLRVRKDASFREWLAQAMDTLLNTFEHQPYALEMAIQDHPAALDPSVSPFNRVMVVMQEEGQTAFQLAGLETESFDTGHYPALLDLVFEYTPGTSHCLRVHYSTALYNTDRIQRLCSTLFNLINSAATNPNALVESLQILTADERNAVLTGFNQPFQKDFGPEGSLTFPDLVLQWAKKTPNHIAVRFHDQSITYLEFDQRSACMARALIAIPNWKKEARAAVLIERSVDLPILMVAIQRAGGCYLPIEPDLPYERIEGLMDDSGCAAIFVDKTTHKLVPPGFAGTVLHTDKLPEASDHHLLPKVESHNLAYMIYTSGSTGQPKGVLVEHRGLVNLAISLRKRFNITSADRVLQFASCSFDASVFDIAMAYGAGAELVMIDRSSLMDSNAFATYIDKQKVTMATLPPSFVEALPPAALSTLRFLMTAGEAARIRSAERYRKSLCFVNGYGPTETTVCASWHEVTPDEHLGESIPIGHPVFNHQITIVDSCGQPCGIGQHGEICISGIGVARGYHNRPELTAASFLVDPFRSGKRMYRTGDRGSWQSDGTIYFSSRMDDQIKLRGFRIEPGEIEKTIERFDGIRDAAVVLCKHPLTGEPSLCGCYRADKPPELAQLQAALARSMPEYMVPTLLRQVESWPLSPSGKIDRTRLVSECVAALIDAAESIDFEPPKGELEERISAVWKKVFGIEKIGRNDNFFKIGGDSIQAIRMAHSLRESGFNFSAADLFAFPSIAGLAGEFSKIRESEQHPAIEDVPGPIQASPIQRWFLAQQQKSGIRNWFNQSILLEMKQHISVEELSTALEAVSNHHGALRLRLQDSESTLLKILSPAEARIQLKVITQQSDVEAEIGSIALKDQQSIDLVAGPIVLATLFDGPKTQSLLLTVHHLCVDHVSWRILCEDLGTALDKHRRRVPIQLPPVSAGWRQWVELEEKSIVQTRGARHESNPVTPPLALLDLPASEREERHCLIHTVTLSAKTTATLRTDACRSYQCRWREMILYLLSQSLCRQLNTETLTIATEGHGRESIMGLAPERVVGWFTRIYPITLNLGRGAAAPALNDLQKQLQSLPNTNHDSLLTGAHERLPQILFHDMGINAGPEENEWFRLKESPVVPTIHEEFRRCFALEIVAETSEQDGFSLTLSGPRNLKGLMQKTGQSFIEAANIIITSIDQRHLSDQFDYNGFTNDQDLKNFLSSL